jgi:uncharacterized protein (DUF924 family)
VLVRRRWAAELLHFWFGRLQPGNWFAVDARVDEELRRRFAQDWAMLSSQSAREFLGDPHTALAAVLLFDQLPRNLFRGAPQAYLTDALAQAITHGALAREFDAKLTRRERQFLAMPLMHSEDIADQRLSLRLYVRLGRGNGWEFARTHHAMIARFGRFPHRNEALGRRSTPAEKRAVAAGFNW